MNQLPMEALTARDRERLAAQLYTLLGAQVKSYHKHYHMGDNSSIPVETARELTESIWYTVGMAGTLRGELADLLARGQEILAGKMEDAQTLYRLVCATVPEGQSQCHWETLRALGRYLDTYDHLHFAHRGPEWLDYPLLAPMPDGLRGIDSALFYLNSLWMENQILAGFPAGTVEELYAHLPPDYWEAPQNLCEQSLWNGMAKSLLGQPLDNLLLESDALPRLAALLSGEPERTLGDAVRELAERLALPPAPAAYTAATVRELLPRLKAAMNGANLANLFITI